MLTSFDFAQNTPHVGIISIVLFAKAERLKIQLTQ
jgi:hypothetical protein